MGLISLGCQDPSYGANSDMSVPYASAMVDFLDRDSQVIKKAMMYPITRIELRNLMSEENPQGLPARVFVVDPDGKWLEVQ